jgi:integrase/recombinase XerD
VAVLQTVDFSRNPHATEFGRFGLVNVRYGSVPKRRSVLTVRGWSAEAVEHWVRHGLPLFGDGLDLFPTERGTLVSEAGLGARFRRYRDDLCLDVDRVRLGADRQQAGGAAFSAGRQLSSAS